MAWLLLGWKTKNNWQSAINSKITWSLYTCTVQLYIEFQPKKYHDKFTSWKIHWKTLVLKKPPRLQVVLSSIICTFQFILFAGNILLCKKSIDFFKLYFETKGIVFCNLNFVIYNYKSIVKKYFGCGSP